VVWDEVGLTESLHSLFEVGEVDDATPNVVVLMIASGSASGNIWFDFLNS